MNVIIIVCCFEKRDETLSFHRFCDGIDYKNEERLHMNPISVISVADKNGIKSLYNY